MKHSKKCGDFPWNNKWHVKMNSKPPRYFCDNCDNMFYTGKYVCACRGCYPTLTLELVKEYIELRNEHYKENEVKNEQN